MAKRQLLFPALILLLATLIRLSYLDIKPPHFDEGINGWFCDQMAKTGYYAYDPTNYHGPLHFYVLFVSLKFFGRNLWALRLPVVLASLVAIFWIFLFRPFFGQTVCYLAALGMAISPGFIFYDRYSIHESWMVLFLLVTCWGILGLSRTRKPKYFWGFFMGLTGMILTKETYIIHLAAFAAAGVLALIWNRMAKKAPLKPINAQSPPGHAMPRPSPVQNTPKDQSSRPTINFREFSGRRVRGRCTKHPTARTKAATADAPSAAGQSCESIDARSVGCRYPQRARADAAVLEQGRGPRTNSGDRPCRSKFLREWRQQV